MLLQWSLHSTPQLGLPPSGAAKHHAVFVRVGGMVEWAGMLGPRGLLQPVAENLDRFFLHPLRWAFWASAAPRGGGGDAGGRSHTKQAPVQSREYRPALEQLQESTNRTRLQHLPSGSGEPQG